MAPDAYIWRVIWGGRRGPGKIGHAGLARASLNWAGGAARTNESDDEYAVRTLLLLLLLSRVLTATVSHGPGSVGSSAMRPALPWGTGPRLTKTQTMRDVQGPGQLDGAPGHPATHELSCGTPGPGVSDHFPLVDWPGFGRA